MDTYFSWGLFSVLAGGVCVAMFLAWDRIAEVENELDKLRNDLEHMNWKIKGDVSRWVYGDHPDRDAA